MMGKATLGVTYLSDNKGKCMFVWVGKILKNSHIFIWFY